MNVNESIQTQSDFFDDIPIQGDHNKPRHKRTNEKKVCNNIAPAQSLNKPLQILSSRPNKVTAIREKTLLFEISLMDSLFLNLFPTTKSKVNLFDELPFFDHRPAESIEFDDNNDYDVSDELYIELPIEFNSENKVLLQSGYVLKGVLDDVDDISYGYLV